MNRELIIIVFLSLVFFQCSYARFHAEEKRVRKHKISQEIIDFVESNHAGIPVKYYRLKTEEHAVFYEAKVKSDRGIITLIFDSNNQLVSTDSGIHYLEVPEESRVVINSHLSENFKKFKVDDCRDQKLGNQRIYEVDVSVKKKRYRFRFNYDGTVIDYKEIPQKSLDLIFH